MHNAEAENSAKMELSSGCWAVKSQTGVGCRSKVTLISCPRKSLAGVQIRRKMGRATATAAVGMPWGAVL